MSSLIEVKNVRKQYKDAVILERVNVNFDKGKSYGIMGYNGSGKSVFLKLLVGYAFADEGKIFIDGKQLKRDMDFIQNAGVVINAPEFINNMSAFKNLKYLAEVKNIISDKEINDILDVLNLSDAKNKNVGVFSQGMKQRLRIAQALMEKPEILILDEPMNALDKEGVQLVKSILKKHVESGNTLIFTSHIKDDFDDLADEVYEIDKGMFCAVTA